MSKVQRSLNSNEFDEMIEWLIMSGFEDTIIAGKIKYLFIWFFFIIYLCDIVTPKNTL